MRILFVSAYFTYPEVAHGGGTDLLEIIKALSQRHEVHLVSFADPWEVRHVDAMRRFCRTVEVVVPANRWMDKVRSAAKTMRLNPFAAPFILGRRSHREIRRRIAEVARRERIDLVQYEWAKAAQFVDAVSDTGVLAVLDEVDVAFKPLLHEASLAAHPLARRKAFRRYQEALQAEIGNCRSFDLIFTRSEADAALLRCYLEDQTIAVLRPWTRTSEYADVQPTERQHGTLVFVGAMDRKPNVDAAIYFCRQILPLIQEKIRRYPCQGEMPSQGVRLVIVGADPPRAVRELARDPAVAVTGYVPDLRRHYAACDVFVAPMRIGGGVSNKVIDAMGAGRPVVATSVANEGVVARPGEAILIGDSPEAFADHVVRLMSDRELWLRIANGGRRHVQETFDWHNTVSELEEHYRRLLESRCAHSRRLEVALGRA